MFGRIGKVLWNALKARPGLPTQFYLILQWPTRNEQALPPRNGCFTSHGNCNEDEFWHTLKQLVKARYEAEKSFPVGSSQGLGNLASGDRASNPL